MHLVYFAAVGWEAHGVYGTVALVLLGMGVLAALCGEPEEEV